ncbi:YARHG domain-containing protein [Prevotella koreensis]|uniref:YARHG domain-containing protein n=1 Tax=Prevotella koreensis TaxID=2490854 RepID=UPI0028E1D0DF|nr:YARHG domain-containing protein [Prevotella koreensis]
MKKIIVFLLVLMQLSCVAQDFSNQDDSYWTDGMTFFVLNPHSNKKDFYVGSGGTLHEGGVLFGLQGKNGKYILVETDNGEPKGSQMYQYGQYLLSEAKNVKVELKTISDKRYLLFYSGKELITVFHEEKGKPFSEESTGLYKLEERIIRKILLAGEYIDSKGDLVTFSAKGQDVYGLNKGGSAYKIMEMYDMPDRLIKLSDGTIYEIEHDDDGLTLTKMKKRQDDFGDFEPTEYKVKLYHVLPNQMKGTAGKTSRFDFASNEMLYIDWLGNFTNNELRLMRNEIYARHGYRFSTPDMQEYFSACPWYSPRDNNDAAVAELSEIEKINVQQIKRAEKQKIMNGQ